jgi:hypothetical protein
VRGLQSWDANNIIVPLLDGKKPLFAFKCLHRTFNFPVVLAVNEKYVKENKDSKKPDGIKSA